MIEDLLIKKFMMVHTVWPINIALYHRHLNAQEYFLKLKLMQMEVGLDDLSFYDTTVC